MTQIEQIKAEIERLKDFFKTERKKTTTTDKGIVDKLSFSSKIVVLEELLVFINSLPDKKPSEDLEEAATALTNEIVGELNVGDYTDHSGHNAHWHSFKEGVVAGAQWQKEKIINKASQWLNENVVEYHPRKGELRPIVNINAFREAMED